MATMTEVCDRHMFMQKDEQGVSQLMFANTLGALMREPKVAAYLGKLASRVYA